MIIESYNASFGQSWRWQGKESPVIGKKYLLWYGVSRDWYIVPIEGNKAETLKQIKSKGYFPQKTYVVFCDHDTDGSWHHSHFQCID